MSDIHAGKKISPDEYFIRQKEAEDSCRKRINRLIVQSIFFVSATIFFVFMYDLISSFFIVWGLFIFICGYMSVASLFRIRREINYYKFSLERIAEYMLDGGIVIDIPREDYEKFDVFKSKKEKYKAKSIYKMQKEEKKKELKKQKELEQAEYEKRIDEQFRKQYYPDSAENDK